MPVYIADDPLDCVVKGTGKTLDDLERLKTYIRIPTESNRVAFVNILEKYIFTYNINVNDFNISQYLLVESSNEFQHNANIFLSDYLER